MADRILPNNLDELLKEIEREWNALDAGCGSHHSRPDDYF